MADDNNTQTATDTATPKKRGGTPRSRPRAPRVTVTIDRETIESSVRRDSRHCMIAEALKQAMPSMTSVTVDLASIRFTDPARRLRFVYITPRPAQIALIDFDRGVMPKPFSVVLKQPGHITRNRGPDERTPSDEARQKRRRERANERRAAAKRIYAQDDTQPFKPPRDYARQVVAAMDDPNALLGPAVALELPDGGETSTPIFVGGSPPRHRGNVQRTRVFGLKDLVR